MHLDYGNPLFELSVHSFKLAYLAHAFLVLDLDDNFHVAFEVIYFLLQLLNTILEFCFISSNILAGLLHFALEFVHFSLFAFELLPEDEYLVTKFVALIFFSFERLLRFLRGLLLCGSIYLFAILECVYFCFFSL